MMHDLSPLVGGEARLAEPVSVVGLIAAIARANPDRGAIECSGRTLTYQALVARAAELAASLRQLGAEAETVVGVCVERSIEHAVATLGVLWSGAAFLPLDPAWPADRLRWILDDAGARIVIASEAMKEPLSTPGRSVVGSQIADRPRTERLAPPAVGPEQLAYVIYTSGSTGQPKGVEIPHRALANLAAWHRRSFEVTADDRASWLAGLGFDASVWELFGALASGTTLCVASERDRVSAEGLRRWLLAARVSIAFVPTPLAEALIGIDWPANTALRWLLTGGDTLHARPRPGLPFAVANNYGPAECAVVATSGLVNPAGSGLPTIGWPIAGARVLIVTAAGRAASVGQIGEICIAGLGLGRGYRHQPALTAEKFVELSVGGRPPERCYRTGDLGCLTATGEIAFRGRNDDQIQHHGQRIEPDEVAAALARHPFVGQSAVIGGGEGLIAYVAPAAGATLRGSDLRAFLATRLPHYMLPAAFVRIADLPITANGKLDKAALPPPSAANSLPNAPYRMPVSAVERRVAALIEELLDVNGVGLDDNFFLLGGHSLLGTQLVLRLQDSFGAELALRDLFEAPTVQELAAKVEGAVVAMVAAMSEEELQLRLAR
ncbi:MAG TPA: non-ribosomal peptide synthetase [Caulobacteraceae bacterium]|jgi:amino acid adenylation domain-containing protein|nr:non-ribosomal peptide synthetase [Caulobacteraceae bacterium]